MEQLAGTGASASVQELPHRGFYRVEYSPDWFQARPDVGVVGGKIIDKNGILVGGKMNADGDIWYEGLPPGSSGGYQHDAVLVQEAEAVDLRCVVVRPELYALYRKFAIAEAHVPKLSAPEVTPPAPDDGPTVVIGLPPDARNRMSCAKSLAFSKAVRESGFRILWDPAYEACAL